MTSTSHRKCQYRGEGCTGLAHRGYDQCAHCQIQYIKPALRAERDEMKRRKAIRQYQLSAANRALINEVDLREPQIRDDGLQTWVAPDEEPKPLSVRKAVSHELIDQEINRGIDAAIDAGKDPYQVAGDLLFKAAVGPPPIIRFEKEEPIPTEAPAAKRRNPGDVTPLTAETKQEIIDAYLAGMSVAEICHAYEVGTTRLYATLRAANVPLRGAQGGWSFKESYVPTPHPTPAVSSHVDNGVVPTVTKLTEWIVTYQVVRTETVTVHAKSFGDVPQAALGAIVSPLEGEPFEIISVARVRS